MFCPLCDNEINIDLNLFMSNRMILKNIMRNIFLNKIIKKLFIYLRILFVISTREIKISHNDV